MNKKKVKKYKKKVKYELASLALKVCLSAENVLRNMSNWFGVKASFIIGRWM
jgi:hypothetical protein